MVGDTNGNQDIFVRDMVTNEVIRVSISSSGVEPDSYSQATAISDD
ncbi:hypothetical protein KA478_00945 [Patescibacteria group bacterium]|nr:hypothetical protein [Patescibacteria group bacterium]